KEKAYIASMKSDLRNFVTAEEAYFADSLKYTGASSCTPVPGSATFCTTTGNVLGTPSVTSDGWTVNITSLNTTKTCSVYIGNTALPPANKEGEPKCQ
ncbi:MAG TPA: hypothetical protein VEK78_13485, partial [Gemmatimonadales bacterium]|nr:hypothetical protein [Gemmatimonadales bacterium]